MGVKSLIFLGLLVSAIFSYICINSKKDEIYASIHQEQDLQEQVVQKSKTSNLQQTITKPKITPISTKSPSFAYVFGAKSKIAAILSTKDRDGNITHMIKDVCGDGGCVEDIKYVDDRKEFIFTKEVLTLINHSVEKNIDAFSLYINKNEVKVDGILKDEADKKVIDEELEHFKSKGYTITNNTHTKLTIKDKPKLPKVKKSEIKPAKEVKVIQDEQKIKTVPKVTKIVQRDVEKEVIENMAKIKLENTKKERVKTIKKAPIKENKPKKIINTKRKNIPVSEVIVNKSKIEPKDIFVIPTHISVDEARYRINDLLLIEPINFELDKSEITKESKQTLDKIADILLEQDGIKIEVAGYTDRSGDETYNRVLSQKRADAVKKYLIKAGIRKNIITSKGYGSSNPISDDPLDTINRRVEIHIKE